MLTHPMAQRIEHWPLEKLIPWARKSQNAFRPKLHRSPRASRSLDSTIQFYPTGNRDRVRPPVGCLHQPPVHTEMVELEFPFY
jgi:hypothetical protein